MKRTGKHMYLFFKIFAQFLNSTRIHFFTIFRVKFLNVPRTAVLSDLLIVTQTRTVKTQSRKSNIFGVKT